MQCIGILTVLLHEQAMWKVYMLMAGDMGKLFCATSELGGAGGTALGLPSQDLLGRTSLMTSATLGENKCPAAQMAGEMGVPFLGRVPLDPALGAAGEAGRSAFAGDAALPSTPALRVIVARLLAAMGEGAGPGSSSGNLNPGTSGAGTRDHMEAHAHGASREPGLPQKAGERQGVANGVPSGAGLGMRPAANGVAAHAVGLDG